MEMKSEPSYVVMFEITTASKFAAARDHDIHPRNAWDPCLKLVPLLPVKITAPLIWHMRI